MYEVILTNGNIDTTIHYTSSSKTVPHLSKMDLDEKAGQSPQFVFTSFINNPSYNIIFDLKTLIKIIKDNEEVIFRGRVFQSPQNMSSAGEFSKAVTCEGELSYLNDTRSRIWTITNMSVLDFITKVLDNHNSHTTTDKQIQLGRIEVSGSITCTTAYENSLNVLVDKMINVLEVGYLNVRNVDGIRYLDYVPQYTGTSADINLGENMKDLLITNDPANVATRIIPLGDNNLTIATANSGVDYLENASAVSEFGVIEQIINFSGVTTAAALKTAGQSKLDLAGKSITKLSSNILDLSTIGLNPDSFFIGTDTHITNEVATFDETFTIIEKQTDLLNPQDCKITVNDKVETLTDRQMALERVSQYVEKVLTSDKQLNTFWLSGYINLLKNQMGAMADSAELQQPKAILFEDRIIGSPTYGAMCLGTQGLMIASTILNGDWDWRTFGTGKGFTADSIVGGTILTSLLNAGIIKSLDGKVQIDLDGGTGLIVKNGDNEVIIDGLHNMHKIMVSGVVPMALTAGQTSAILDIPHGLGYSPCHAVYLLNSEGEAELLPVDSFSSNVTTALGIIGTTRCWVNDSRLQIYILRTDDYSPATTFTLRYYLYKEVAI